MVVLVMSSIELNDYPIEGLKEVIAIKDGQIVPIYP